MTRKFTPTRINHPEWLVLVGNDGTVEHHVQMAVPDETFVRRLLNIRKEVPILIGPA